MNNYDLELEKVADKIKKETSKPKILSAKDKSLSKAKTILIQLPDGLKPEAKEIREFLAKKIDKKTKLLFWAGSCFGSCDVPLSAKNVNVDLIIQFGHSEWR